MLQTGGILTGTGVLGLGGILGASAVAPFDPSTITGYAFDYNPATPGTVLDGTGNPSVNGGVIATWQDAVGGFHATQADDALRPLLQTDGINGLPSVAFNGARGFIHSFTKTVNPSMTVFLVLASAAQAGYRGLISSAVSDLNNYQFLARMNPENNYGLYSQTDINEPAGSSIQAGLPALIVFRRSATGNGPGTFYRDGAADGPFLSSSGTATNGTIGGNLAGGQGFSGVISRIIGYTREITDDELAYVHAGLLETYGITP